MRRILLPLLLLAALPLTGCGTLLERSYASVTPHTQFSDLSENEDILRAETYQGLVSALLHLVEQGPKAARCACTSTAASPAAPPATWTRPAWK